VDSCFVSPAVYEMLCQSCSPSNNNNNGISPYLTFGDYSVLASEMKRVYAEDAATAASNASKIPHKCDKRPSASEFIKSNSKSTILDSIYKRNLLSIPISQHQHLSSNITPSNYYLYVHTDTLHKSTSSFYPLAFI
jgi:hypothetical protein